MPSEEVIQRETARVPAKAGSRQLLVWDLPTRLFHWVLVVLISVSIYTGLSGGRIEMMVHMWSGISILTLVAFRLVWGVVGGKHARFVDFVKGPGAAISYGVDFLRGKAPRWVGHNPLGGWSIVAMLLVITFQATTGLFSNDDIFLEGPLFHLVGKETSDQIAAYHVMSTRVLFGLIGFHMIAVFLHLTQGENLIKPMIDGHKDESSLTQPPAGETNGEAQGRPVLAFILMLLAAASVAAAINL